MFGVHHSRQDKLHGLCSIYILKRLKMLVVLTYLQCLSANADLSVLIERVTFTNTESLPRVKVIVSVSINHIPATRQCVFINGPVSACGFVFYRWGRGHPEEYRNPLNLGEDNRYDPEQKPRAGQILWIRGLTRLQTQVRASLAASLAAAKIGRININFFCLLFTSFLSCCHCPFYLIVFYWFFFSSGRSIHYFNVLSSYI